MVKPSTLVRPSPCLGFFSSQVPPVLRRKPYRDLPEDLGGQEHQLIIAQVTQETINDNGNDKRMLKLHFQGQEKGLLLNKTNAMTIADALGENTDYWVQKPIILYPTKVDFAGKMVDAIRIRPVLAQAQPGQALGAPTTAASYAGASGGRADGGPPVDSYNQGGQL